MPHNENGMGSHNENGTGLHSENGIYGSHPLNGTGHTMGMVWGRTMRMVRGHSYSENG